MERLSYFQNKYKMFKGIIFDIDGTLTSTNELIFASFNHITKKYLNKTMSNEEIIALFGPTEDAIIESWFNDIHEIVKDDYYKFYKEQHYMASLYPGIKELIIELKEKNIKLGIFTGKGRKAALITLEICGLIKYFDLIISGDDVKEHKPSPEGINLILEKFNLSPEEVLMVGDSPADIIAARGAGLKVASVLWDSYAKEKIVEMKNDLQFNTVGELKKYLFNQIYIQQ